MRVQTPREIELKFECDPADLPRVRALLERRLGPARSTKHLVSVYYDTPELDLKRAGMTLRIRSLGPEAFVQTIKRGRGAGAALFDRDEWETPSMSQALDVEAIARTPAGSILDGRYASVSPLFETTVDRALWPVTQGGSHIEVALDEGRVVAGDRSVPLAELEIELKQGAAEDLFRWVRDLGDVDGLRLGVLAKSERGYRLLRDQPSRPSKAEAQHLHKRMSTGEAFQAIVHNCLRHFCSNIPMVVDHRDPEGLHQARVALRRLRSALSLFKPMVTDQESDALKGALRHISRALGEARDLDIYLVEHTRHEGEQGGGDPDAEAFLAATELRRMRAYDAVVATLRSPDTTGLLLRLVAWAEAGAWLRDVDPLRTAIRQTPVRPFAAEVLEKHRRRVKRRGRHLATLDPEARHQVRIEAKQLRYASEFFAALAHRPKAARRHERFISDLKELQEHLGQLNDIETGQGIARCIKGIEDAGTGPSTASALFAPAAHASQGGANIGAIVEAAAAAHVRLVAAKRFWSTWPRSATKKPSRDH